MTVPEAGRGVDADSLGLERRSWFTGAALLLAATMSFLIGCAESGTEPVMAPVDPPNGVPGIYLAQPDGSVIGRLTSGAAPAWSPDGRRIAFDRDGLVRVIDVDGTSEVPLSAGTSPTWSPDGARIAFVTSEGISVMNVDGSAVRTLIRHDFRPDTYEPWNRGVGKPAWSPDGSHVAFHHQGDLDDQPAQIFVMNSDGTNARLATATTAGGRRYWELDPSWSPDGSRIVYWSVGYGIAVFLTSDGAPNTIYSHLPFASYRAKPAFSPDGSTITFNYARDMTSDYAVWTVPATGGQAKPLIPSGHDAAWSPDGRRIAFVRGGVP